MNEPHGALLDQIDASSGEDDIPSNVGPLERIVEHELRQEGFAEHRVAAAYCRLCRVQVKVAQAERIEGGEACPSTC